MSIWFGCLGWRLVTRRPAYRMDPTAEHKGPPHRIEFILVTHYMS